MKKSWVRCLTWLLTAIVLLSGIPCAIASAEEDLGVSGKFFTGESSEPPSSPVSWTLEGNQLTITGNGSLSGFSTSTTEKNCPSWYGKEHTEWRKKVTKIVLAGKITGVGNLLLNDFVNLETLIIPCNIQDNKPTTTKFFVNTLNGSQAGVRIYFSGPSRCLDITDKPGGYAKSDCAFSYAGCILTQQVLLGESLGLRFRARVDSNTYEGTPTMDFALTAGKVTLHTVEKVEGEEDGVDEFGITCYRFDYTGLAPQYMGCTVTATLKSQSGTPLDTVTTGIAKYCEKAQTEYQDNEKLQTLVGSLLVYGAAAQMYTGYDTEHPVAVIPKEPLSLDRVSRAVPETAKGMETLSQTVFLKSAGVAFSYTNRFYFKFVGGENTRITINDAAASALQTDDGWIVYTDAISADELIEYTCCVRLYSGDDLVQTLHYSLAAYTYAMQQTTEGGAMRTLAEALYRYGVAALAYVSPDA